MAIKVVQGLIDVGRSDFGRSPQGKESPGSASQSPPSATDVKAPPPQPSVDVAHQFNAIATAATQVIHVTEASVSTLRGRSQDSEARRLRDPEDAKDIADTVANKVEEGEGEGQDAHSNLSSSSARQHFTQ